MKAEEKKTTELAEELWDSFSEYINDDLDSLQYVAGKNVIFRAQFLKALVQKDAELKEAEKAIEQNESAIRMLAKQRDEMDAKLKEAREFINHIWISYSKQDLRLMFGSPNVEKMKRVLDKQDKEKGDTEQWVFG